MEKHREKGFLFFSIALILVAVGTFTVIVWRVFYFTVDDAFIFFRYSRNLANGIGPTYNATPPPAEGYTSFLWMLLMAIPHWLNIDVVLFSKTLGLLFTLLTFITAYALVIQLYNAKENPGGNLPGIVVVFMLATFLPTGIHAIAGMETSLFTFLLIAFTYAIVKGIEEEKTLKVVPFLGLLCGFTRPEGNLIVLILFVMALWKIPKSLRKGFIRVILITYFFPGMIYFLWRVNYYSLLLPLPFLTKVTKQSPFSGFPYVAGFILEILPLVGIFLIFSLLKADKKIGLVAAAIIPLLLGYTFPRHIMGYDWRFLYPLVPLMFALAGKGFANILLALKSLYKDSRLRNSVAIGLTFGSCLIIGMISLTVTEGTLKEKQAYATAFNDVYIPLGEILRASPYKTNPPVLAITDAGVIPYISQWEVIDINGYNDPVIATSGELQSDYILSRNPDLIILVSSRGETFVHDNQRYRAYFEDFMQAGMVLLGTIEVAEDYYLWLLVDPDSSVTPYLWSALRP